MKNKLTTLAACALSAIAISASLISQQVVAQEVATQAQTSQRCKNTNLKGAYSFDLSGWHGAVAPFIPYVASRLVNFDGRGNWTGAGFSVVAGSASQKSLSGHYAVNRDCTVNFDYTVLNEDGSLSSVTTLFGVIVDNSRGVHAVVTSDADSLNSPPNAVTDSVNFRKVK